MRDPLQRILGRCAPTGECLVWRGALNGSSRIPSASYGGQSQSAMRVVYCLSKGRELDFIAGRIVWATCCTPLCLQPQHLRAGGKKAYSTWKRHNVGSLAISPAHRAAITTARRASSTTKLDAEKAAQMRAMRADGLPLADCARPFGVSTDTAFRVCAGQIWQVLVPNASVFHQRA